MKEKLVIILLMEERIIKYKKGDIYKVNYLNKEIDKSFLKCMMVFLKMKKFMEKEEIKFEKLMIKVYLVMKN